MTDIGPDARKYGLLPCRRCGETWINAQEAEPEVRRGDRVMFPGRWAGVYCTGCPSGWEAPTLQAAVASWNGHNRAREPERPVKPSLAHRIGRAFGLSAP